MQTPASAPHASPSEPAPAVVEMAGVEFAWPGRRAFSLAIKDFRLSAGERVLLVGPSGSGKSTMLNLLSGIITPSKGRLAILGHDMASLSKAARDRFRAEHMGLIFQMFNLLPYGSVIDNTVLPLAFARTRRQRIGGKTEVAAEAARLLSRLGLDPSEIGGAAASDLSTGQQQRVAAARALIGRPELIIADEPTSALDRDRQDAFLELLFAELRAAGSALLMVSHDTSLGRHFDRVVKLGDIAVSEQRGAA